MKADDEGLFLTKRVRDAEARVAELFEENKLLKADKERALGCIVVLEAEATKPNTDSVKCNALHEEHTKLKKDHAKLMEEHAKLVEELRAEKSLRTKGEEDLYSVKLDLAACRVAFEKEHEAHLRTSKEAAELSVEVVNQEAQLEWWANENKGLAWENSSLRVFLCRDDDLFDSIFKLASVINETLCSLGAPMVQVNFEEGDCLSAVEWGINALGFFPNVVSTFGSYCFSFGAQALVASIEKKCEHVKVTSMANTPLCTVSSLRGASQAARSAGRRLCSFLWEREGIESFIRGQVRIRSLEVSVSLVTVMFVVTICVDHVTLFIYRVPSAKSVSMTVVQVPLRRRKNCEFDAFNVVLAFGAPSIL